MKTEIENLVRSEDALLRLSPFCALHRWTKDALGTPVDHLTADFRILSSHDASIEIKSRDWNGILVEVQEAQTRIFAEAAKTLNREISNGYIRG